MSEHRQFSIGEYRIVPNSEREIIVAVPDGYDQSDTKYPVLYILDGDWHFTFLVGLINGMMGKIPKHVIVAIPSKNRMSETLPAITHEDAVDTDGTPLHERFGSAGGADRFLEFFKDQVIPFVEASYRCNSFRTLMGHSLTGLLTMHCWVHSPPGLIRGVLCASPSMQFDMQQMAKVTLPDALKASGSERAGFFYFSCANEGGPLLAGCHSTASALAQFGGASLKWRYEHKPLENHGSVVHPSVLEGLLWGWSHFDPDVTPATKIKGAAAQWGWINMQADEIAAVYGEEFRAEKVAEMTATVAEMLASELDAATLLPKEPQKEAALELLEIGLSQFPDNARLGKGKGKVRGKGKGK